MATFDISKSGSAITINNVTDEIPGKYTLSVDSLNEILIIKAEDGTTKVEIHVSTDTVNINGDAFSGTAAELKAQLLTDIFASSGGSAPKTWTFLLSDGHVTINGIEPSGRTVRIMTDVFSNKVIIQIDGSSYEISLPYDSVTINGTPFSGTIGELQTALTDDIFSGWVLDSGPAPYNKYVAILTQTGTSVPTVTELENTIGVLVLSRATAGQYNLTKTGAFPAGRTFIHTTCSVTGAGFVVGADRFDEDNIAIVVFDETFSSVDVGGFSTGAIYVEIRVYPAA
jgi:hypothetical protein